MALSEDDKDKEKIKFNTEMVKMLGLGILTVGGGTITLYTERGADSFTVMGIFLVTLMGIFGAGFLLTIRALLQ